MTENEELSATTYSRGWQGGVRRILAACLRELSSGGDHDALRTVGHLTLERSDTIETLRQVCAEYGDNNWADDLHLGDIIEKHLRRNLDAARRN